MKRHRDVGTVAWARRTGGRLSALERWRQTAQGVVLQLSRLPEDLRRRLGLPSVGAPLDLDPLAAPDSALAKTAEHALAETSPPALVHHGYRAYAWGRLLAARARHRLDAELFYAACLLHDLGLVLEPEERPPSSYCFAYDGAEAARRAMSEAGADEARAAAVAEAICLHLNVRVALRHGAEAHYLNAGSALDVIGLQLERLPREQVSKVLEVHPRDGFGATIGSHLEREVEERPGSRIHFLVRRFAFDRRAARVRFPS